MMPYSVQPRYRIFVKGYGFLSSGKTNDKNISKNLRDKYNQNLLHYAKQSATNAIKATS